MEYCELILKVSSCCNLNCDYCYVYNQGDTSYQKEPALMNKKLIPIIIKRIAEHCREHRLERFFVVFHGGEPLMQKMDFYEDFVETAHALCPNVTFEYGVQTNGTLLSVKWIDLFKRLNIQIGLSIDGPKEASSHRVFRSNGKPAYEDIIQGANLIKSNKLTLSTLSVINVNCSPSYIYKYIKSLGVEYTDFCILM